jgi:hypothetical protein
LAAAHVPTDNGDVALGGRREIGGGRWGRGRLGIWGKLTFDTFCDTFATFCDTKRGFTAPFMLGFGRKLCKFIRIEHNVIFGPFYAWEGYLYVEGLVVHR